MAGRINGIETVSEHGDGFASGIESGTMSDAIDADSESADDSDAGSG